MRDPRLLDPGRSNGNKRIP
uniref:Uncharacterized protein n=1 Tax=Oryza nivara TaxID=4536 RepID=A0A0E0HWD5_ORYNI